MVCGGMCTVPHYEKAYLKADNTVGRDRSTVSGPDMAEMLELTDREFKTTMVIMPRAVRDQVDSCKNRQVR